MSEWKWCGEDNAVPPLFVAALVGGPAADTRAAAGSGEYLVYLGVPAFLIDYWVTK